MQPSRQLIAMALSLAVGLTSAARADEAAPAAINVRGRVLVRGSINPVPSAVVMASPGQPAPTDEHGYFALALPAGDVDIAVTEPRHQTLHLHETVRPGVGLAVEYLLLPL